MPTIQFADPARCQQYVSQYTRGVLLEIMADADIHSILITSTARTLEEQALVMFNNLERFGVQHQKRLYSHDGDLVINEYAKYHRTNNKAFVLSKMRSKILEVGPLRISNHIADPAKLNVIDIAPSSIHFGARSAFEKAIKSDSRISRSFMPPDDPAYHLEIPQPEALR